MLSLASLARSPRSLLLAALVLATVALGPAMAVAWRRNQAAHATLACLAPRYPSLFELLGAGELEPPPECLETLGLGLDDAEAADPGGRIARLRGIQALVGGRPEEAARALELAHRGGVIDPTVDLLRWEAGTLFAVSPATADAPPGAARWLRGQVGWFEARQTRLGPNADPVERERLADRLARLRPALAVACRADTPRSPGAALEAAGCLTGLARSDSANAETLRAEALAILESALRREPDNWLLATSAAQVEFTSRRFPEAERHQVHAVALRPESDDAHYLLAQIRRAQGRRAEALDSLRAAIALRPDRAYYQATAASIQLELGDRAEAARLLDDALRLDPRDDDSNVLIAGVLVNLERAAEAVQRLQIAIQASPSQPYLYLLLARAHEQIGQRDQARAALETALRLQPDPAVQRELERLQDSPPGT